MQRVAPTIEPANRLLASLSRKEYGRVSEHLSEVALCLGDVIHQPGEVIKHIYFPISGVIALFAESGARIRVGAAFVGREGMVGVSIALGETKPFTSALVQGPGSALRMTARHFRDRVGFTDPLSRVLRSYTHNLLVQISQTLVCNQFHAADERLARWLLLIHDRLESDEFALTQQFLADILGVRRETVTTAARALLKANVIRYVRGRISIVDRAGLESHACVCYGIVDRMAICA